MDRYLVESPHTEGDCEQALTQVAAMGYILHYDWGCKAGVHKGWAIIECDSETEALLTVPPFIRHEARAFKLTGIHPMILKSSIPESRIFLLNYGFF